MRKEKTSVASKIKNKGAGNGNRMSQAISIPLFVKKFYKKHAAIMTKLAYEYGFKNYYRRV